MEKRPIDPVADSIEAALRTAIDEGRMTELEAQECLDAYLSGLTGENIEKPAE